MRSENNGPFLPITSMTHVIEVSHWGSIAAEENMDLKGTGAVLKGPFSSYDYRRQPDSGVPPSVLSRCGLLGLDTGRHCDCLVRERTTAQLQSLVGELAAQPSPPPKKKKPIHKENGNNGKRKNKTRP